MDGRFHFTIILRAEKLRYDYRASDIASKCECDEDERDIVAVSDRGKCIFADEFAGDKTVRNIVELLENNAAKHRQAEFPQYGLWISHG